MFRLTPSGNIRTLVEFCVTTCVDGQQPWGGVIQGSDGNFYGTTFGGGTHSNCSLCGGTIFKIAPDDTFTSLYSFCAQTNCTDGANPIAALVEGTDGNFYGTTENGGVTSHCPSGCGTIFKITPQGTLTTLYNFCSLAACMDGETPQAALVQGTDGNFYGTTSNGGGGSTVFRITPTGVFTTLHRFTDAEGGGVLNTLVQGTDGAFYGTANVGGNSSFDGTVFRIGVGLGPFVHPVYSFGAVGTRVTIVGTNLTGATAVSFNGTAAIFTVPSPWQIATTVPAGATTGNITVTLPGSTLTSNVAFTVLP